MQLKLNLTSRSWLARFPQSGAASGWSEWQFMDRLQALGFLERGWTYTVEG